jgi:hypothetical protein
MSVGETGAEAFVAAAGAALCAAGAAAGAAACALNRCAPKAAKNSGMAPARMKANANSVLRLKSSLPMTFSFLYVAVAGGESFLHIPEGFKKLCIHADRLLLLPAGAAPAARTLTTFLNL